MKGSITIGIISRNRASVLPQAIQSAINQNYSEKEISVFDDASTDNTKELKVEFPQVNWTFESQQNGIALSRNKLMRASQANYFCSLDDDAWFLNGEEITTALAFMEDNQDVAAVAFDILSPDGPTTRQVESPIETNMYIGCGHILRLSMVKEVDYYYVFPGFYGGEEKDLCIRLMNRGYKIYKLPGIHVWHDKTNIARDLPKQHRSGVFNDLVFTYRCTPMVYLLPALANKFYKHTRFSIRYKKSDLWRPCLQAFGDFLKLCLSTKIARSPVSIKTLKKYYSLNKS